MVAPNREVADAVTLLVLEPDVNKCRENVVQCLQDDGPHRRLATSLPAHE